MAAKQRKALFSSVEQLKRKASLNELSGDLQNTLLSVSRQHLGAIGSLHSLTEQGVRAAEATASEIARASDEIAESMVRLEWQVNDTREAMTEIGARFEWGMSEMLVSFGGMADSLSQLVGLATSPAQTAAYEQFEIARDAFRRRLYPECLEALDRAIDGDTQVPGYRLEWRFHMLRGVIRLGDLPEIDTALIDRESALESFEMAARYAETDEPKEAARALLAASRAAFVEEKMERAIQSVEEAIRIAPEMAESHYRAAKYKAASGAFESAIPSLRAAVNADSMYLLKIASDPAFQAHDEDLDGFLSTLRSERLAEVLPLVEVAAERVKPWSSRCKGISESDAWKRWTNIIKGAPGWGFFDLHRYQLEVLSEDEAELAAIIATVEELDSKIRSALASIEDEAARYPEIASHKVVTRWHDMLDLGGLETDYSEKVDEDLRQLRLLSRDLEELEARVQDAFAKFGRIGEHAERIYDHPTMIRWREMIEGRRWTKSYASKFERENAALAELVEVLRGYSVEKVVTKVEQSVREVTQEGRWLFRRKSTRIIKRLVERERTVLANGLGDRIPGPEMIEIPAAEFTLGPGSEAQKAKFERDVRVQITRPYLLAAMPVSQQLYEAVTGENPSPQTGIFRPVHGLAWHDAVRFCNAMSELYDIEAAYEVHESLLGTHVRWKGLNCAGFRLPTAAEWEYACRAGGEEQRYAPLEDIAWHADNSNGHPHPVGRKKANEWGLFDMLGNVENWVWDHAPEADDEQPPRRDSILRMTGSGTPPAEMVDPTGPSHGEQRVSCGDGYTTLELEESGNDQFVRRFRASARRFRRPGDNLAVCGVRLARSG